MTCIFCTKKTLNFQNPDRDPVLSSVELLSFFYRKLGIWEKPLISSFQDIPNCEECYLLYGQLNEVYLQLQTLEERAQRISHELQKRVVDSVTLNERSKGRGRPSRTKQFRGQILQSYSKIHKPSNVDERIDVSTTVGDEDVSCEASWDAFDSAIETFFDFRKDPPIKKSVVNSPRVSKCTRKRKLISSEPARSGPLLKDASSKSVEEQYGLKSCTVRLTKLKDLEYSDNENVPPASKCRRGRDDPPNFELAVVNLKQEEVEIKEESFGYDPETVSLNEYPVDPPSLSADGETYKDSGDEYIAEKDERDEKTESSDPSEIEHSSDESWCSEVENTEGKPISGRKSTINSNLHPKIRSKRLKSNAEAGRELEELTTCPVCEMKLTGGLLQRLIHVVHMHELRAGEDASKTSCSRCDKQYFVDLLLKRHEETHNYSQKNSVFCDYCSAGYVNDDGLHNHLKAHLIRIDNAAKSKKRTKQNNSYPRKVKHIEQPPKIRLQSNASVRKELEELTTCPVCHKKLTGALSCRLNHVVHMHELKAGEEERKSCSRCDKQYAVNFLLKRHQATHDSQTKTFHCDYCSAGYLHTKNLQKHLQYHFVWIANYEKSQKKKEKKSSAGKLDWECQDCSTEFATQAMLIEHDKVKHLEKYPHMCEECDARYSTEPLLETHSKSHSDAGPYDCLVCSSTFENSTALWDHLPTHTGEFYRCKDCNHLYRSMHVLSRHKFRVHKIQPETKLECPRPDCGKFFLAQSGLTAHIRSVHLGKRWIPKTTPVKVFKKKFPCPKCVQVLNGYKQWLDHQKTNHSEYSKPKMVECEVCKKLINVKKGPRIMMRHLIDYHESLADEADKNLQCKVCQKKFQLQVLLERHEGFHQFDKTKPLFCEVCDIRFLANDAKGLANHIEIRHKSGYTKFLCQACPASFFNRRDLMIHFQKQHPELLIHHCTTCGKKFACEELFKSHVKIHSEKGPYDCSYCKQEFGTANALEVHLKSHIGESREVQNRVLCQVCGESCKDEKALERHSNKVHSCTDSSDGQY